MAGECGGLGVYVKGHMWTDEVSGNQVANEDELCASFEGIMDTLKRIAKDPGISGGVYTQLSDVEGEDNGLMTYDREVCKIQPDISKGRLNGWLPPRKKNPADLFVGTGIVELDAPAENVKVVYTLDGSDPTAKSPVYQKPISITRDTVVTARAIWPDGGMSGRVTYPMKNVKPAAVVAAGQTQPGLRVAVYELKAGTSALPDFSQLQPDKTAVADRVNLTPKTRDNNFGLVFDGFLVAPVTGAYGIRVTSDDGAEVMLDGKPVCGKDGVHGDVETAASVALEAGSHPVRIRYFQGSGGQSLRLDWAVPGSGFVEVPASAFSHSK